MYIDFHDLNLRFPGWRECLDDIKGELRGELVAWAFMNDLDEVVSPAVWEAFHKNNEQSCRRDIAEWLMNMYVDHDTPSAWIQQTRDMHWNGVKWFIEKYLPEEEAEYERSMGYVDDIEAFKRQRDEE